MTLELADAEEAVPPPTKRKIEMKIPAADAAAFFLECLQLIFTHPSELKSRKPTEPPGVIDANRAQLMPIGASGSIFLHGNFILIERRGLVNKE
jgi:hypothetical protein